MILVMFETWWDKHLWTQRLHSRLWKSLLQCWRCREPAPAISDIELLVLKHFDTHSDIRNFDIALNILTHILSCQNLNMILMLWWIFPSISPWSQFFPHFWWRNVYFNPVWHLHRGRLRLKFSQAASGFPIMCVYSASWKGSQLIAGLISRGKVVKAGGGRQAGRLE